MTTVDIRPAMPAQRPAPDDESAAAASWVLIDRAQAGDADAFADLYRRYRDVVLRFVRYRLPGQTLTLAEDLTQDVFVRAIRGLPNLTWQGRDPGAWLTTIARNLVADYFKASRYRREHLVADHYEVDQPGTEAGPDVQAVATNISAAVRDAMASLTEAQRQCLDLRFWRGLSVEETADALDITVGACKAIQYRATRALARVITPEDWR